jgi:hypothetical protein
LPVAKEQKNGAITAYREGAIDYISFLQNMKDSIQIEFDYWNSFASYLDAVLNLNICQLIKLITMKLKIMKTTIVKMKIFIITGILNIHLAACKQKKEAPDEKEKFGG